MCHQTRCLQLRLWVPLMVARGACWTRYTSESENAGVRTDRLSVVSTGRESSCKAFAKTVNHRRSTTISESKRKTLTLLDIGHRYQPKARDRSHQARRHARREISRRAFFQQFWQRAPVRSSIAGCRQAILVLLRPPDVMEFSSEVCAIIDILSGFFFLPIYLL